jgi:hypothetical protein
MRLQRLNPGSVVMAAVQAISKALHDGKILVLNVLSGHTITLPAAVGSGATFTFIETVAPTSATTVIKVQNGIDVMMGSVRTSLGTGVGTNFPTAATSDTVTLNRGTTGGVSNGEWIQFIDVAPGFWLVEGALNGSGALATPFSATVT